MFSIKNTHWMHVEIKETGKPTQAFDFTVAIVGGQQYMQVHDAQDTHGYFIMRYEINAARTDLKTWAMDSDKAVKIVNARLLHGTFQHNYPKGSLLAQDVDVTLTDDSPALQKFLTEKGPGAIFCDKGGELQRAP